MFGENEFKEIRKVSSEIFSKFSPVITIEYISNKIDIFCKEKNKEMMKVVIFCLINQIMFHEQFLLSKKEEFYKTYFSFFLKFLTLLKEEKSDESETMKFKEGISQLFTMLLKFELELVYSNKIEPKILFNLLEHFNFEKINQVEEMDHLPFLSNVFSNLSRIISTPKFSSVIKSLILDRLISFHYHSRKAEDYKIQLSSIHLQILSSFLLPMKSEKVFGFSDLQEYLNLAIESMQNKFPIIRKNGLKLVGVLLVREDVFSVENPDPLLKIQKLIASISNMDQDQEVQKLAETLTNVAFQIKPK